MPTRRTITEVSHFPCYNTECAEGRHRNSTMARSVLDCCRIQSTAS